MIDYTIATLNFYCDTGMLQVRPDGMWQLANNDAMQIEPADLRKTEPLFIPGADEEIPDPEDFIKKWMNKNKNNNQNR
jgi:hypothetical protein